MLTPSSPLPARQQHMKCLSQVHFFHKLTPSFDAGKQAERFPMCQEQVRRGGGKASATTGPRPTHAPAGGESRQPGRSRSNSREIPARWNWSNASPESISSPAGIASESRSRRPNGGRRLAAPSRLARRRPCRPYKNKQLVSLAIQSSAGRPRPARPACASNSPKLRPV